MYLKNKQRSVKFVQKLVATIGSEKNSEFKTWCEKKIYSKQQMVSIGKTIGC